MKKVHIKSAIPIYFAAAVWLLAGLIFPRFLLKLSGVLAVATLSAVAGIVALRFFPGREIEVEERVQTGDADLDADIAEGKERLNRLHAANEAIPNPEISRNLERMTGAGEQIFKELARDPKKVTLVRRFMNYYLPTSEKLMDQYQILMSATTKGENIQSAMQRIESSLGMIADAFEKCLDNLYADQEMDIDAEIQVMKTMLASDRLIDDTTGDILKAGSSKEAQHKPFSMGNP